MEARLAGVSAENTVEAEIARGQLPPGELGRPVIDRLSGTVQEILQEVKTLPASSGEAESLDIRLRLTDGRVLSGTVPGLSDDVLLTATYSRVNPQHRLAAWVHFLSLSAACPERAFEAFVIGRARQGHHQRNKVTVVRLPALEGDQEARRALALSHLEVLIDIFDRGMREPLPLACRSSAEYARAHAEGKDAEKAARKAWESSFNFDKEDKEEEHRLVWGGIRSFDALLEDPPRPDEAGEGWDTSEASRFGRYAVRMWGGLLAREVIEDR